MSKQQRVLLCCWAHTGLEILRYTCQVIRFLCISFLSPCFPALLWFTANLLKCSDVCGNHRVLTSHAVESSRWAPSKRPLWAPVAHLCLCAGNSINSLNLPLFLEGRLEDKWPDRANISGEPLCHWLVKSRSLGRFLLHELMSESDMTCWSTVMCLTERSVLLTCHLAGFCLFKPTCRALIAWQPCGASWG